MKIAIFAPNVGVINRGAETFVIELSKELSVTCEVTVYSTGYSKELSTLIKVVECKESVLLRLLNKIYLSNKFLKRFFDRVHYLVPSIVKQYFFSRNLYRQYKSELKEFDIIFPNNGVWGLKLAAKIRRISGAKIFYTGHGGIGKGEKINLKCDFDKYVALTPQALNWCEKYSKKVVCIPNGVAAYSSELYIKDVSYKDSNIVLCVAALVDFKRQDLLIRAMTYLPEYSVVFVGTGDAQERLESLCKRLIPSRYTFKALEYTDVLMEYRRSSVFTLPSENEPFGIVYLEALRASLPVVAPDDLARRFVCGEHAIYCDVTDPVEYSRAILNAHKLLDTSGCFNYVRQNFSWEKIAKSYYNLFLGKL